jgi:flagellar hook protein FlgE
MGSALFTGVTGLQANQRRLDVIASNISNVNTTGYRSARVLFQDLFSQTLQGSSAPVDDFGGSNGQQVGLGVRIGAIDINFNQGTLFTTGVPSDLAIQGSGFFVLNDGSQSFFTRDGSFQLNANGALFDPGTGLIVQGFLANPDGTINVTAAPSDLVVPVGSESIVRATTTADMIGNLDSSAAAGDTVVRSIRAFDSLGTARDFTLTFTKTATANEWTWTANLQNPSTGNPQVGTGTITFNPDGTFLSTTSGTISVTAADLGALPALPVLPFQFALNFDELSQLADTSDATLRFQDGIPRGILESFNIGGNGVINGVFTNGLTQVVGQIALATFSNEGALLRAGDNLFIETPASGARQVGLPGSGSRGSVSGGVLEGSNVDLGTEFSNLIITQRSFQANARTITTADTLLQETVNLVR